MKEESNNDGYSIKKITDPNERRDHISDVLDKKNEKEKCDILFVNEMNDRLNNKLGVAASLLPGLDDDLSITIGILINRINSYSKYGISSNTNITDTLSDSSTISSETILILKNDNKYKTYLNSIYTDIEKLKEQVQNLNVDNDKIRNVMMSISSALFFLEEFLDKYILSEEEIMLKKKLNERRNTLIESQKIDVGDKVHKNK